MSSFQFFDGPQPGRNPNNARQLSEFDGFKLTLEVLIRKALGTSLRDEPKFILEYGLEAIQEKLAGHILGLKKVFTRRIPEDSCLEEFEKTAAIDFTLSMVETPDLLRNLYLKGVANNGPLVFEFVQAVWDLAFTTLADADDIEDLINLGKVVNLKLDKFSTSHENKTLAGFRQACYQKGGRFMEEGVLFKRDEVLAAIEDKFFKKLFHIVEKYEDYLKAETANNAYRGNVTPIFNEESAKLASDVIRCLLPKVLSRQTQKMSERSSKLIFDFANELSSVFTDYCSVTDGILNDAISESIDDDASIDLLRQETDLRGLAKLAARMTAASFERTCNSTIFFREDIHSCLSSDKNSNLKFEVYADVRDEDTKHLCDVKFLKRLAERGEFEKRVISEITHQDLRKKTLSTKHNLWDAGLILTPIYFGSRFFGVNLISFNKKGAGPVCGIDKKALRVVVQDFAMATEMLIRSGNLQQF